MKLLLVWLLLSNVAFAAEVCVTVDDAAWTQRQKNLLTAVAYELSYETDPVANRLPRVAGNRICVDDPTFDVSTVLSQSNLETRYAADEATREAARIAQEQRIAALTSERASLEADVDAAISTWATLTPAEKTEALRKSMRLNRVYRLLQSP